MALELGLADELFVLFRIFFIEPFGLQKTQVIDVVITFTFMVVLGLL
jgi:hypothetical protein